MTDTTDEQAEVLLDALIGVLTPDSASCPSKQRRPYLSPRRRAAYTDTAARPATPQQPDAEDRILSLVEERAGLRMALTTLTEMGTDDAGAAATSPPWAAAEGARRRAGHHPGLGSREAPAGTPPSAGRRRVQQQHGAAASPSFAASSEPASESVRYVQVVPSVMLSESVVREREAMQHLLDNVRSRRTAVPASSGGRGVLCYESSIVDTSQTAAAAAAPAAERFVPARDAFILSLLEKLRVARSRAGEGGGGEGSGGGGGGVRSSPRGDAQAAADARAEAVEEKVRAERLAAQNGELARRAGAAEAEAETLRAQAASLESRCGVLRAEAASKEAAAHEGAAEREALRVLLQNAEEEMVELLARLEHERRTLGAAVAESDDDPHDASTTAAAAAAAVAESAVLASELEEARRARAAEVEEAQRAREAESAVRAAEVEEAQRAQAAQAEVSAAELEEAKRHAEGLAARLFEVEKERDALSAERAALGATVGEERAALRGARAEADRLKATLAAREADVEGLRREAVAAAEQHEGGGSGGSGDSLLAQLEDANGRARGLQAENARLKVEKAKSLHATDTERQHMLQTLNEQYGIIDELRAEAVRLKAQAIESPARAREAEGSPVSLDGGGGGATIMLDLVERNSELERELDEVRRRLSGVCVEKIKDESVLATEIEALGAEKRSLAAQLACEALSHQQAAREVFALKPTAAQLSERSALDGTEGAGRDGIVQEEKAALQPLVMLALRGQSRVLLTTKKRRASRGSASSTSRVSGGSDYAR